jgi:hypothetical protein
MEKLQLKMEYISLAYEKHYGMNLQTQKELMDSTINSREELVLKKSPKNNQNYTRLNLICMLKKLSKKRARNQY